MKKQLIYLSIIAAIFLVVFVDAHHDNLPSENDAMPDSSNIKNLGMTNQTNKIDNATIITIIVAIIFIGGVFWIYFKNKNEQ
jgi:hypothetical protein